MMNDSRHQITVSTTTYVEHCTVPCRRSFAETKAALEAAVPLLDRTYQRHLDAGDLAAAGEALRMLPPLNRFGAQPRNFRPILEATAATTAQEGDDRHRVWGSSGGANVAAAWTDGGVCPDTRSTVASRCPAAERASDRRGVTAVDRVWFEYNRPSSTMGNSGIRVVDEIAEGLNKALHEVLVKAAGLELELKPKI
ncbi:hypothetical protein PG995_004405 [Apiospora arundinis]